MGVKFDQIWLGRLAHSFRHFFSLSNSLEVESVFQPETRVRNDLLKAMSSAGRTHDRLVIGEK